MNYKNIVLLITVFTSLITATSWADTHTDSDPESDFEVYGFVSAKTGLVESQSSWLNGWFGRFDQGDSSEQQSAFSEAEFQAALEWSLGESTLIYLHARARSEDTRDSSKAIGLVEGFIEHAAYENESDELVLQLGQIFLPSSQENKGALWQSPYTLTLSTWNSWIAQEVRPISFNVTYSHETLNENQLSFTLGAFKGNDSLGSQLAWGGWRMTSRLSVTNEILALPPVYTLADNQAFADQRDDGSKPIGKDLDGQFGYHAQFVFRAEDFNFKVTYLDNNGDRGLSYGEYAWDTKYTNLGFSWQLSEHWELLSEWSKGSTGMGLEAIKVDLDFTNVYLMTSYLNENHRLSIRYENFKNQERDFTLAENNDDSGHAWTIAWIYNLNSASENNWQFGLELVSLTSDNAAQGQSGFLAQNSDKLLTFEVKRRFN